MMHAHTARDTDSHNLRRYGGAFFWALLCLGYGPVSVPAQQIQFKVEFAIQRINEEKQQLFIPLQSALDAYMNGFRWVEGDLPRPLEITLQIHVKSHSSGFEEVLSADLFMTVSNGRIYSDRRWGFPYKESDLISHDRFEFSPFLDLIDHYVYRALGDEMDEWGSYAGDPYYDIALDIAAQGEFSRRYSVWWDKRKAAIQRILMDDNQGYRNMLAHFRHSLVLLDQNNLVESPEMIDNTFALLQEVILTENLYVQDNVKEFFRLYNSRLVRMAKAVNNQAYIDLLVQWDPERTDYYESHRY